MSIMVAIFDFRSTQKNINFVENYPRTVSSKCYSTLSCFFLCELSFLQEDIFDFHYYKFTFHYRFMNIINKCKYFKQKITI